MARIAGVDLPRGKRIEYALTYIFGIGLATSRDILGKAKIDLAQKSDALTDEQNAAISKLIEKELKVEGDLRRERSMNIKRLMDLGCYRGTRHKKGLPVRGQRTRTNSRTRKGPRKQAVANKKTVTK